VEIPVSGFVAVKQMSEIKSGILSFLTNLLATTEELDELAEIFKSINTSNDGFITKQELRDALEQQLTSKFKAYSNDDWDEMIKSLSSNDDEQIDFAEFISAAYDHKRLFNEQNLETIFSVLDRDKTGCITKENFQTALGGGKNEELMANFDHVWQKITEEVNAKDEDSIDFEEFKTGMRIMKQSVSPDYISYREENRHNVDAVYYTGRFLRIVPDKHMPEYH